ncbi:uncharacterized protein LOC6552499 [Drosophila erecta]|uniref:GG17388 n=1 Tax=Drosophila erecta TaxID=7220 RepID=B3P1S4_DROER|nr:uncharacterized protein LOC6552499 [Drosophila erecta]EDV49812.1 uncharacterized protein Dere_GG17388 [Drosophila erecta]
MSQTKKAKRPSGFSKDATWKKLGFLPAFKEGKDGEPKKYRALCTHCRKCQSNTSIDRLILHRKSCPKFREDLTAEFGIKMETTDATPAEQSSSGSTIDFASNALLDKLIDEDDSSARNQESNLVSYLTDLDQLVMPSSDAHRLQKDLIKAETEYLVVKSEYFTKMNEISELKRTATLLEAKKTQLEIAKLRAECE